MSEEEKTADASVEMSEGGETGETKDAQTPEGTPGTTPVGKMNRKPRPRYFPYRKYPPPFRGGFPHPPPFRPAYPMYPPHRMWSPRPARPPMTSPIRPPHSAPPDAPPQQEPQPHPTEHWTTHVENAIFRPCFDWLECSEAFPRVNPEIDDSTLNESLTTRGAELLPTEMEVKAVQDLVQKVLDATGKISAGEEEADEEVKVDEAILVGSFKKKTYMKGAMSADIVVLLKELPTEGRVDKLSQRLIEQLKVVSEEELAQSRQELEARIELLKNPITSEKEDEKEDEKDDEKEDEKEDEKDDEKEDEKEDEKDDEKEDEKEDEKDDEKEDEKEDEKDDEKEDEKEEKEEEKEEEKGEKRSPEELEKERVRELNSSQLKLKNFPKEPKHSFTFNKLTLSTFLVISSTGASAKVFSTTEANLIKQEDDSEDKVDLSTFQFSLQMVRHAKWFEAECQGEAIPCLVRVLKDMKKRFPSWKHFHPWLMDLMAHKAVVDKNKEQREIGLAFRHVLQLISGGCFLPGFYGLEDPCEKQSPPAHYSLKDDAKDEITLAGQILLRMLQNGAYREIIGGQGIQVLDLNRPFSVGGIQFAPPQKAFEVPGEENVAVTAES